MAIISIIGTSGVGKSFLTKQLASLTSLPAFFEGEEGTIPKEILKNVFSKEDPNKRYKWFLNRYKTILNNAKTVSDTGLDCYVDCSKLLAKAVLASENATLSLDLIKSDKTILLTASKEKLQEQINLRNRSSENNDQTIKRAIRIQDHLIKLSKEEENTIIIDRSNLDFTKEKDLKKILKKIMQQ